MAENNNNKLMNNFPNHIKLSVAIIFKGILLVLNTGHVMKSDFQIDLSKSHKFLKAMYHIEMGFYGIANIVIEFVLIVLVIWMSCILISSIKKSIKSDNITQ